MISQEFSGPEMSRKIAGITTFRFVHIYSGYRRFSGKADFADTPAIIGRVF
jgi:hypothetical protein